MMNEAPIGSKGVASASGWMVSEPFLPVLQHFTSHETPTKEHRKLIIMDNHESHLSICAIDYARDNGIIILTLPPHCSHKLQPLDVAVFGPFKKFYNQACETWMLNNPGRPITIYNIAKLIGQAYPLAFTPKNICSGFKKTGIEPFDPENFSEQDFLSSYVTDRPRPEIQPSASDNQCLLNNNQLIDNQSKSSNHFNDNQTISNIDPQPSTSSDIHQSNRIQSVSNTVTPEQLKPYPKAAPRKHINKRQKTVSTVLTSIPEKLKLEERAKLKEEKEKRKIQTQERKLLKVIEKKKCYKKINNLIRL